MKRGVLILGFFGLLILSLSFGSASCFDSDGGINEFVYGRVNSDGSIELSDTCYTESRLMERYCTEPFFLRVHRIYNDSGDYYGDEVIFSDDEGLIYEAQPMAGGVCLLQIGYDLFNLSYSDTKEIIDDEYVNFRGQIYYEDDYVVFYESQFTHSLIDCEDICLEGVCIDYDSGNCEVYNHLNDGDSLMFRNREVSFYSSGESGSGLFVKLKIDYETIDKEFYEGDSIKTDDMVLNIAYIRNEGDVVGVCLNDNSFYCPNCYDISSGGEEEPSVEIPVEEPVQTIVEDCVESWTCSNWSLCVNGMKARSCFDSNNCGIILNKPIEIQSCDDSVALCVEGWKCSNWSECLDGRKYRTCFDSNNCGTELYKPLESRYCFEEASEEIEDLREPVEEKISDCLDGCDCIGSVVSCPGEGGRTIQVKTRKSETIIMTDLVEVSSNLNLEKEMRNGKLRLKALLSRGELFEINVVPDLALNIALERLNLDNCDEDVNCRVELRELEKFGELVAVYELQADRTARVFGLFKKNMPVKIQVDAGRGEILEVDKPWWAFLAYGPRE